MTTFPTSRALGLDGQAGADDIGHRTLIEGQPTFKATGSLKARSERKIDVLVLGAEDDVDQRALVHHVFEAAAGEPACCSSSGRGRY